MRHASVLLAVLLVGCGTEVSTPQLRQPLPGVPSFPLVTGRTANAQLGTSVAGCRGPGFVAGAPGEISTLLFLDGGRYFPLPYAGPDAGVGLAVACEGGPTALTVVSAGEAGLWAHRLDGGSSLLRSMAASALERGPTSSTPMLAGFPTNGVVELHAFTGTGFVYARALSAAPGFGTSVAWDPLGHFFAVGDVANESVRLFGWDGGVQDGGQLFGPSSSDFGRAIAIADVHPSPGPELIVGATGSNQVFIYGEVMGPPRLVMVLDAVSGSTVGSFGASFAVEPTPVAGSLHALWVGDPGSNRLFRFVGDAGEPFLSLGGGGFGTSLAVAEQNLLIGAPRYSESQPNGGAVYSVPFGTTVFPATVPMECATHLPCVTQTCQLGSCVGGVLCVTAGNPLCSAAQCVSGQCTGTDAGMRPDAGSPDAGEPDAGAPDAGESDAGETDAGEPDAGRDGGFDAGVPDAGAADAGPLDAGSAVDGGLEREKFGTCGCSGAGAVPLVLLSVMLSRRARRQRRHSTAV